MTAGEDGVQQAFADLEALERRRDAVRRLTASEALAQVDRKQAELRYRNNVGANLGTKLFEELCSTDRFLRSLNGEDYALLSLEEGRELGIDDDQALIIRRKSDGHLFEVEMDVLVHEVQLPEKDGENGVPPTG